MSDKLPVFSSKEFIRAAKRLGFEIKKGGKGGHTRLVYSKSRIILSVPKAKTIFYRNKASAFEKLGKN